MGRAQCGPQFQGERLDLCASKPRSADLLGLHSHGDNRARGDGAGHRIGMSVWHETTAAGAAESTSSWVDDGESTASINLLCKSSGHA
jgi:hypothetical protein